MFKSTADDCADRKAEEQGEEQKEELKEEQEGTLGWRRKKVWLNTNTAHDLLGAFISFPSIHNDW